MAWFVSGLGMGLVIGNARLTISFIDVGDFEFRVGKSERAPIG
jgi:hypothetical protein